VGRLRVAVVEAASEVALDEAEIGVGIIVGVQGRDVDGIGGVERNEWVLELVGSPILVLDAEDKREIGRRALCAVDPGGGASRKAPSLDPGRLPALSAGECARATGCPSSVMITHPGLRVCG